MSPRKADLIPAIIKPPPVDEPATVAGLEGKLTAARAEADVARGKLANLGDKAGKHGPRAEQERRQAVMLRIPGDTITRIDGIARSIGSTRAGAISMLVTAASQCPPADWFKMLAGMPRR
jgi:hypothetical protein